MLAAEVNTRGNSTVCWQQQLLLIMVTARMPCLHANNLVIWDSLAIAEWVAEQRTQDNAWPADRRQRAEARAVNAVTLGDGQRLQCSSCVTKDDANAMTAVNQHETQLVAAIGAKP